MFHASSRLLLSALALLLLSMGLRAPDTLDARLNEILEVVP